MNHIIILYKGTMFSYEAGGIILNEHSLNAYDYLHRAGTAVNFTNSVTLTWLTLSN